MSKLIVIFVIHATDSFKNTAHIHLFI